MAELKEERRSNMKGCLTELWLSPVPRGGLLRVIALGGTSWNSEVFNYFNPIKNKEHLHLEKLIY